MNYAATDFGDVLVKLSRQCRVFDERKPSANDLCS